MLHFAYLVLLLFIFPGCKKEAAFTVGQTNPEAGSTMSLRANAKPLCPRINCQSLFISISPVVFTSRNPYPKGFCRHAILRKL